MPEAIDHGKSLEVRAVRPAIIVIGIVVLAGGLKVAAVAVLPIVASLLLCLMFWPLREWLCRWMPAWLSAFLCCAVLVVTLATVAGLGWYASDKAVEKFRESKQEYVEQYREFRSWLTGLGVPEKSMPELHEGRVIGAENGAEEQQTTTDWERTDDTGENRSEDREAGDGSVTSDQRGEGETRAAINGQPLFSDQIRENLMSMITGGLRSAGGIIAAVLLTIFLAFLALLEGRRWADWAGERIAPRRYDVLHDIVQTWSMQTRWYFLGKTISGVVSGGATWIWLWSMGVPMAAVWGVFTLLMNYIPNIGALISGLPPTVLAIVELGWGQGLIVAAGLLLIETLVGNLLDPLIQGRLLKISAFVTLASLVFWGWLWGVAGAVLAPVLTAIIVAAVAHLRAARQDAAEHNATAA